LIEVSNSGRYDPAWQRKPNFAFIDAANIYQSACQLLKLRGVDQSQIDQFDFRCLFVGHDRCFVYHALDEDHEVPSWLQELQNTQGFIAKFGRLAKSGKKTKQQGVDVLLAVDAMQCSFRRSMTSCALYTGDGDFLPLIDALVENGTFVKISSFQNPEKGLVTPELRNRADSYEQIGHRRMASILKDGQSQTKEFPKDTVSDFSTSNRHQIEIFDQLVEYYDIDDHEFPYLHTTADARVILFKNLLWLRMWHKHQETQ